VRSRVEIDYIYKIAKTHNGQVTVVLFLFDARYQ